MNDTIASLFVAFLTILIIAVVLRALLSWFPNAQRNEFARILYQFTEPLLAPVRRIIPPMGGIDLSSFVVIILLYVMISVVRQAANS